MSTTAQWFLRIVILACLACTASVRAQSQGAVRLSGSASVSADVYDFTSTDSTQTARRPPTLFRLLLTPTITIGDYITLPFNIMLSSRETNVVTPNAKNSSFLQFIQNPMNNLGFLSFAPRIGWLQTYVGTHVPQYSELSAGDEQIFGLGVDMTPGDVRIAASAGTSQRAIEPDSAAGVRGAYARHVYMAKVGYGHEESSFVHVNVVRAKDDPASLQRRPEGVTPQEGLLLSTNFRIGFSDVTSLAGEAGVSDFTRDLGADMVDAKTPIPDAIFRHRISTRTDYAGTLAFAVSHADWGVRASGKYIGAGYVSLGYPFMQPDRLEFQLAPRVRLFDKRLNISGSIGHRTNNLSQTKGSTTTQIIGSANVIALVSDAFSVTARYSNFGIRNAMKNDTLKVENVSNSVSISPAFTFQKGTTVHTITASFSIDAFTDYNTITGAQASNNSRSAGLTYIVAMPDIPLTVSVTGNTMTNDLPLNTLNVSGASLGLSSTLFEGALAPSLTVSYSRNALGAFTADQQYTGRAGVQWKVTDWLSWTAAASINRYAYGSAKPGATFRETLIESALSTQF